jgi:molecular chaperone GrpE
VTETNEELKREDIEAADGEHLNGVDQLATLAAERDDYLDRLQRTMAEFANYRRRVEQERLRARAMATQGMLTQLLPLMDDLKRALANVPVEQAETSWVQGVEFIEKKLAALLEREGVTEIEAVGQPFDPALHEAVATVEGSTQNVVNEVYASGYKLGDQVLRPAMVKVGDRPEFQA